MKKIFYFVCLSALLLPAGLWASDDTAPAHKGPNAAVKKYIKETVMPVLIQKRQQFDRELSATEKNEIAECKAALKQLQNQHQQWNHDRKAEGDNKPAPDYNNAGHAQNPQFAQRKAIMERLQAITDKHSNSLQDIKTQLEPARKQWVEDLKKLQPVSEDAKSDDYYHGERHMMEHDPAVFLYPHHMSAVHFLLLPATPGENAEGELKSDIVEPAAAPAASVTNLVSFELMPNPATNDVQLGNDILPATNQLKVIDLQGKEVLSLENVQAAQHLNVSQLANGTYLIQIKSGSQLVSKKIVISR